VSAQPPPATAWRRLVDPVSVAVVGANDDLTRYSGAVIAHMRRIDYQGGIYPVHRTLDVVQGLRAYPTLSSIPEPVDTAVMLVNPRRVPELLNSMSPGVGFVVVPGGPSGLSSGARASWDADVLAAARLLGARVVGPNCVGVLSPVNHSSVSTSSALTVSPPPSGSTAVIAHSGGMLGGVMSLGAHHGVGFSHLFSTGDELDVTLVDVVGFLVEDPQTRVICLIAEGLSDVPRLTAAARAARERGKSIVMVKLGRSRRGALAAVSHSGRMMSPHRAHAAVMSAAGVLQCETVDEMLAMAAALTSYPEGAPRAGVAMVSRSGGACSYVADRAETLGLELADLEDGSEAALHELVGGVVPTNPIDLGSGPTQAADGPAMVQRGLEILAGDAAVGVRVMADSVLLPMKELAERTVSTRDLRVPVVAGLFAGDYADTAVDVLRAGGVPTYRTVDLLLAGTRALIARGRALPKVEIFETDAALEGIREQVSDAEALTDFDALRFLSASGLAVPAMGKADDVESAVSVAARVGYPVALKGIAAGLAHKSDLGAVRLSLASPDAVRAAAHDVLRTLVERDLPQPALLVQAMAHQGLELGLGSAHDPRYGTVISVFAGGTDVELHSDTSMRPAPVSAETALEMLRELAVWPLLQGYRGSAPVDVSAVVETIVRFGRLMAALDGLLAEVDVNPLLLTPAGVLAVDALFVRYDAASS